MSQFRILLYLFYFPPILALFAFLVGGSDGANQMFMICNLITTFVLLSILPNLRTKLIAILFCLYFIICLWGYSSIEGNKMYTSSVLYTIINLLYFSTVSINIEDYHYRFDKDIILLSSIIIVGQIFTIDNPLSFVRFNYVSVDENALEQKGFLISHSFGYYLAAFVVYFAYKKKTPYMMIFTIICFFFCRRTNVLLCGLGWLYYIYLCYGLRVLLILLSIVVASAFLYLGTTSYLGDFAFSLDPADAESNAFSSGRTLFWGMFIRLLQSGDMGVDKYLFGFGPASSVEFNRINAGLGVWMHNDFIDILYCLGGIGLCLYLWIITKTVKAMGWIFLFFVIIAANINGFMLYQTYPIVFIFAIIHNLNHIKK